MTTTTGIGEATTSGRRGTTAPGAYLRTGHDLRRRPLRQARASRAARCASASSARPTTSIDGQYIVTKADQARLVAGWETLVNYDDDFNISYEHGLAEEIEAKAADHYVIRLKEGIEFHDGKTVTADDVIYSFNRLLDPDLALRPALHAVRSTPTASPRSTTAPSTSSCCRPRSPSSTALAEYMATIVPVGYARFDGDATQPDRHRAVHAAELHAGRRERAREEPELLGREAVPRRGADHRLRRPAALVNALSSGQIDAAIDLPFAPGRRRRVGLATWCCSSRRPAAG